MLEILSGFSRDEIEQDSLRFVGDCPGALRNSGRDTQGGNLGDSFARSGLFQDSCRPCNFDMGFKRFFEE